MGWKDVRYGRLAPKVLTLLDCQDLVHTVRIFPPILRVRVFTQLQ